MHDMTESELLLALDDMASSLEVTHERTEQMIAEMVSILSSEHCNGEDPRVRRLNALRIFCDIAEDYIFQMDDGLKEMRNLFIRYKEQKAAAAKDGTAREGAAG